MANKEKNFVSCVIYVHNAQNRIAQFLGMVIAVMGQNFEHSEIICVNDGSTDASVERVKEQSKNAENTSLSLLNMSFFHGLEMAMDAAVDLAIGDYVFEFDSTQLDFDPAEIMKVYYRAMQGYDIVSASPNRKEKLSSRIFYKTFEHFSNLPGRMFTESFRILSRRVINRVSSMNQTVPYRKAVYANSGLKMDNITYQAKTAEAHNDRSDNKYRAGLAADSLILFTEIGYRLSIAMAILMMIISAFVIFYSVIVYITATPVPGWTTTILFLSVVFFGVFGVLTVVVKYLQLIVNLVFKRKHYCFESIEKLTK